MEYLGALGTLIHEKNLKSKILCQTPFKVVTMSLTFTKNVKHYVTQHFKKLFSRIVSDKKYKKEDKKEVTCQCSPLSLLPITVRGFLTISSGNLGASFKRKSGERGERGMRLECGRGQGLYRKGGTCTIYTH